MRRSLMFVRLAVAAVLPAILATSSPAEVRPLQVGGFAFDLEVLVAGTPEQAFDAFTTETLSWWDHHFSAQPKQLYFEPEPGGGFVEIFDDQGHGARHATVIYAERGKMLRFTGPLGLSGKAIEIVHTLEFAPAEGGTRIMLLVHAAGEMEDSWGHTVEGVWNHFLVERFKPYMAARRQK